MKIAHVADLLDETGGGIPPVIAGVCNSLSSLSVDTLCIARGGSAISDFNQIPTKILAEKGPKGFGWIPSLAVTLADWKPDVIHVHGIWTGHFQAAARFAGKNDIPLVVSPHGMVEPWALEQSRFKKALLRRLFLDKQLNDSSCIHALNKEEAKSVRSLNLTGDCAVIPNGVAVPELSPQQGGIVGDELKTILFLGRLHPKKGILQLLEAWSEAGAHLKNWQLVIAGWDDGGHEVEIRTAIEELNLSDKVSLPGKVFGVEKERLFRQVDAFILPSFSEGLPMTILEAWSYQLPVLMTEECHLQEGFDASAAIKIEPTVESILKGLREFVLLSNDERLEIGRKGRELVENRFTWDFVAGQMNQVYRWVSGQSGQPDCVIG